MHNFHVSAGGGGAHFNYFMYSTVSYFINQWNVAFVLDYICFTLISAYCADWIMLQKNRSAISVFTAQYIHVIMYFYVCF